MHAQIKKLHEIKFTHFLNVTPWHQNLITAQETHELFKYLVRV